MPADLRTKVNTLSGGEKRKIQLYIALSSNKNIVILDEPFNNIDQKTISLLVDYIINLSETKAIMFVDHNRLFETKYHIKIPSQINIKCDSSLQAGKKQLTTMKLKYQLANLNIATKLYLIVASVFLLTYLFTIASMNTLSTSENDFVNQNVEAAVTANMCSGQDQLLGPTTNSDILGLNGYIEVQLKPLERFPLSRTYVDVRKNYKFGAIQLDNPREEVEAYDGQLPFYDVSSFVFGTYPADYSNEVAIPYFYARYIADTTNRDINQLIGTEIEINDQKVVVSGVFRGVKSVLGNNIITSFQRSAANCNPMLNGVDVVSNKQKILKIFSLFALGIFVYTLVLSAFEFNYFRLIRLARFSNKIIIYSILLWTIIICIAIMYYLNYP